jgi:hypothetical protein
VRLICLKLPILILMLKNDFYVVDDGSAFLMEW